MEESPSGGCQLGVRDNDFETWANCPRTHEQEPMNFRAEEYDAGASTRALSRRQASLRTGRKQHTAGQASKIFLLLILNRTLVFVAPPFAKGTYSQAHLYYVLDKKAFKDFNAGR